MTKTRRDTQGRVLSVHESADILRACELKTKRAAKTGEKKPSNNAGRKAVLEPSDAQVAMEVNVPGEMPEKVPTSSRVRTNCRDEDDPYELSPLEQYSLAPQKPDGEKGMSSPSPKSRSEVAQRRRLVSPIGAAAAARMMPEIDLRTPEDLKSPSIGAARASQVQARLFPSPTGSTGVVGDGSEKRGKRRRFEDLDPLYQKAVLGGVASAQKAREKMQAAQANDAAQSEEPLETRSRKKQRAENGAPEPQSQQRHERRQSDGFGKGGNSPIAEPEGGVVVQSTVENAEISRGEKQSERRGGAEDAEMEHERVQLPGIVATSRATRKKGGAEPVQRVDSSNAEREQHQVRLPRIGAASRAIAKDLGFSGRSRRGEKDLTEGPGTAAPSQDSPPSIAGVDEVQQFMEMPDIVEGGPDTPQTAIPSENGLAAPKSTTVWQEEATVSGAVEGLPMEVNEEVECPEISGDMPEPLSAHEVAVNAAVKLLKGRLLGVDGWKGRQTREGRAALNGEFQAHYDKLHTLLSDTVKKGLNVSALLLGPRGGGKTMIVERVVHDLQETFQERVTVVRLNGLVHSDERIALKEVARQLCEDNDLSVSKTSTFELNLRFLTDILTECVKAHRAVIFILDEFDLFAQRPKQTLLYNLLDAIQSSKTQAAVVGISCRLDADELLEKRVRSRFSHRRIQVLEPPVPELLRKRKNEGSLLGDALRLPPSFPHAEFAARFNKRVETILADPDVQSILDVHMSRNQSPQHILDFGVRVVCGMDRSRGLLTVDDFKRARAVVETEPRVESIRGLSVLELYLLIAMKRLEEKERDKYNFQMVFAEYQELRLQNTADVYSRGVSLRAFQHLLGRELVTFADRRPRGDPVEFRPVKLLVSASEIEQALSKHPARSSGLGQWFANKAAGKF